MTIKAIVGGNWGDEGKGKMTDLLAKEADYVVRFQGGNNAGHTIVNSYGKFKLHLLPSGVFNKDTCNVLATGVAVNIEAFLEELDDLVKSGLEEPNIKISHRAQIVLPHHIRLDQLEEKRLGKDKFGSTQKGIAPFYRDKFSKIGIQISDLFDFDNLFKKVTRNLEINNVLVNQLYRQEPVDAKSLTDKLYKQGKLIKKFVCDTQAMLYKAYIKNDSILFEGQLGALRDIDHGIYPMTTSSNPIASFAPVSCGLPAKALQEVVTVVKAYSSCVGNGPFVTEFEDEIAKSIRVKGNEFGATTNRPRRIGWFDVPATRYGCQIQGTDSIALTLLDVLSGLDEIKVCTHYLIEDERINHFDTNQGLLYAKPVYKSFKGWSDDISKIKDYHQLPIEAKEYIDFIETHLGFEIKYISVGPHRESIIIK